MAKIIRLILIIVAAGLGLQRMWNGTDGGYYIGLKKGTDGGREKSVPFQIRCSGGEALQRMGKLTDGETTR